MNLGKSLEVLNAEPVEQQYRIIVIGAGATGSNVCIQLARMGFKNFIVFDGDTVDSKNVNNQHYFQDQVGKPKVEALFENCVRINPEISQENFIYGMFGMSSKGLLLSKKCIVFNCVDVGRKEIFSILKTCSSVKYLIETRMGLFWGKVFTIRMEIDAEVDYYEDSMPSIEAEKEKSAFTSSCGEALGVSYIASLIACKAIAFFVSIFRECLAETVIDLPLAFPGRYEFEFSDAGLKISQDLF